MIVLIHGTGVHVDLPAGSRLLMLDARTLALRPLIARSVGLDAHEAIDDALAAIASRMPLLVVGSHDLDAEAWLGELSDDVLRVDLDVQRFTAPQASALFAVGSERRVVFRAETIRAARRALDKYADRVALVELMPLSARPRDVAPILDAIWREELHDDRGVGVLGDRSLDGIQRYRWPRNIDELREHAPRLLALAKYRTVRGAARALGVAHQTLGAHLDRIGVPTS